MSENNIQVIKDRLIQIYKKKVPPGETGYSLLLDAVNKLLVKEDKQIRPANKDNVSGGIIRLKKQIPTIVVPDLHARMDFFLNVLFYKEDDGLTNLQKIADDKLQIVCVGDGFHAESRAIKRWQNAYEEYLVEYNKHKFIDEEMKESLGVMEMCIEIKLNFPNNFHFLKGNHENVTNERGCGNYPFRKFVYEGPMVLSYMQKFYSEDFLLKYSQFEKNLPLFAVGKNFLVSHAEPKKFFEEKEILEYKSNPDVIEGFTWTSDGSAEKESVSKMLKFYLDEKDSGTHYYFGGHRPVNGKYKKLADGKYIQIHNPQKFIIAKIMSDKNIDLDNDVIELNDKTKEILNQKI